MATLCSNYSNFSQIYDCFKLLHDLEFEKVLFIETVLTYVIISIGLPLTFVAIYGLISLVRTDNVAPIYIINLLFSDVMQFCSMILSMASENKTKKIATYVHQYSLIVNCGFMLCISVERYLVIARPLWYHFRRSIKTSVVACVVVWTLPLVLFVLISFVRPFTLNLIQAVLIFLPLPVLLCMVVGTQRALSASRVPTDEKRRIMALLILVLLTYMLLFLPIAAELIIVIIDKTPSIFYSFMGRSLIKLNPVADLFLYFFLRKGAIDTLLAHVCCCKLNSNDVV